MIPIVKINNINFDNHQFFIKNIVIITIASIIIIFSIITIIILKIFCFVVITGNQLPRLRSSCIGVSFLRHARKPSF